MNVEIFVITHSLTVSLYRSLYTSGSCSLSFRVVSYHVCMERITIFVLLCKHRLIIIFPRLASNVCARAFARAHSRSCSCFLFLTFKTAWIHISKLLGLTFHRRFVESLICSFIILIRLKWNSNIQDISTQQRKRRTEVKQQKEGKKNSFWIFDSYLNLISLPFFLYHLPFDAAHQNPHHISNTPFSIRYFKLGVIFWILASAINQNGGIFNTPNEKVECWTYFRVCVCV